MELVDRLVFKVFKYDKEGGVNMNFYEYWSMYELS